jgi:hypothetical protein
MPEKRVFSLADLSAVFFASVRGLVRFRSCIQATDLPEHTQSFVFLYENIIRLDGICSTI